jgi:hypothetical protein
LEDDELFNAGIGSQIQSDGKLGWVLQSWMEQLRKWVVLSILKR